LGNQISCYGLTSQTYVTMEVTCGIPNVKMVDAILLKRLISGHIHKGALKIS